MATRSHRAVQSGVASLLGGLILWELFGRYVYTNQLFFSTPTRVAGSLWGFILDGTIWRHLYVSFLEFAVGFVAAIVFGVAIGVLVGMSDRLREILDPWVSALYSSPLVALTPFFILVFGVGVTAKAAVVFSVAVFPVLINTYVGMRSADPNLIEVAQSFGATPAQRLREVLFPAAVPFVVTGLRLAAGRGLTGVVVAELFFSQEGIGFLINNGTQTFNMPQVFLGVIIFALAGIALTLLIRRLERRLARWRESSL